MRSRGEKAPPAGGLTTVALAVRPTSDGTAVGVRARMSGDMTVVTLGRLAAMCDRNATIQASRSAAEVVPRTYTRCGGGHVTGN